MRNVVVYKQKTRIVRTFRTAKDPSRFNREESHDEERQERGGILFCKKCGAVHFMKGWHLAGTPTPAEMKKTPVLWVLCPACAMIARGLFSGMLIIPNISFDYRKEMLRLIRAYGERAKERNCQHRVIAAKRIGGGDIVVTTTENQLAIALAKKIRESFKNLAFDLHITFSREPHELARVITFPRKNGHMTSPLFS